MANYEVVFECEPNQEATFSGGNMDVGNTTFDLAVEILKARAVSGSVALLQKDYTNRTGVMREIRFYRQEE